MRPTRREFQSSQLLTRHQFLKSNAKFALTDYYFSKSLGLSLLVSGRAESVQLIRIIGRQPWCSLSDESGAEVIRLISMFLCEFVFGTDSWLDEHLVDAFLQDILKTVEQAQPLICFDIANVELQMLFQNGEISGIQARDAQATGRKNHQPESSASALTDKRNATYFS